MKLSTVVLVCILQAFSLHTSHELWSTKDKKLSKITDITWYYCDLKCLYLQNYKANTDFVVITFRSQANPKEEFADCYAKVGKGYQHWSMVLNNTMYSNICWKQRKVELLNNKDYKMLKEEGIGIGTEIDD